MKLIGELYLVSLGVFVTFAPVVIIAFVINLMFF